MKLQELQDRFERLSTLQTEIRQLKNDIIENDVGFAKTQAEALMAGDDKAAAMKNPGEKMRARLAQLEAIEPHAAKLMSDAAEHARKVIDSKLYPIETDANSTITVLREKLAAYTAHISEESRKPSETLGKVSAMRGELRNAIDADEILRHVSALCVEFNLDLQQAETVTNELA